jgi:hypothetical protein
MIGNPIMTVVQVLVNLAHALASGGRRIAHHNEEGGLL